MQAYNQSRSRIIQVIFVAIFLVIIGQLLHLQIFSSSYRLQAENNAIFRKTIYPDRGIIYDRKQRAILENTIMFDLVVIPNDAKAIDTAALCNILGIDTADYKKRMLSTIIKNTRFKPSVFESLLSPEMYARLNENMYKFPGFNLIERPVRKYPFNVAGNVLGYLAEVDTNFLKKHKDEGYEMGDYAGMTGMERSYEKILMGGRGVKRYIRDNRSRIQGPYENGVYDTAAVAGKNVYTSLDIELQQLGEKLMTNKVGSIVAINPKTGGIICMVSAPNYNPNFLTGSERRKHFGELLTDPRSPLTNRAVHGTYSPGSTFKTVVGIVGLTEGVINKNFTLTCNGAFQGCGNGRPKCLDKGTFNFVGAVAHSDNTYFATVFKKVLDQDRYGGADSALKVFNKYAYTFGLGKRLGIDVPSESIGNIPISSYYRKIFGQRWYSCNIISNAIGQGEVQTTLVQLANVMATIANKGWYYTPHVVDSIEGGDTYGLLEPYKTKHHTLETISDSTFETVHSGMQKVMEEGTAINSQVPGIVVCGKTGTVENYYKGVKQIDHSFFGAFAPRDNPKIAIAVLCENAGQGAHAAAPIASLIIEKYLKDSILEPDRKIKVETITNTNLIPARMQRAMDSLQRRRDSIKIVKEEKDELDSLGIEDQPEPEPKSTLKPVDSTKQKSNKQLPDKNVFQAIPDANLPEEQKTFRKTSKSLI